MSKMRVPARALRTEADAVPKLLDPKRLGEVINDRMLDRMRQVDVASGQSDAERARRMNTSRQQVEHLHKDVGALTAHRWTSAATVGQASSLPEKGRRSCEDSR